MGRKLKEAVRRLLKVKYAALESEHYYVDAESLAKHQNLRLASRGLCFSEVDLKTV